MVPAILGITRALAGLGDAPPVEIVTTTPSRHELLAIPKGIRFRGPEFSLDEAVRNAEILHLHGLWQTQTRRGAPVARRRRVPYLIAAHGMADPWALRHKAWKKQAYLALVEGKNLRHAACLHALTRPEVNQFHAIAPRTPVALIPNGVELGPFDNLPHRSVFESRHPEVQGKFLLLFLARMHQKKGLDLLAEAWRVLRADHPNLHLLLAGNDDGAGRPFLEQTRALGLSDHITPLGHLSGEEARLVWGAADAFILPSRSEGFSMAVLEALAARQPVVVTTACNFPELDHVNGGITVAPNALSIESGLRKLLEMSPAERRTVATNGRTLVESEYTWLRQAEKLAEVYRWLAHGGSAPQAVQLATPSTASFTMPLAVGTPTGGLESSSELCTDATPSVSLSPSPGRSGHRIPVSVLVPTKNEAANLRRCLPALEFADEVLVVDSLSTDDTASVVESNGAHLVPFTWNGCLPKKKNWSLENIPFRNEWVLVIDADEVVTPALAREIGDRIAHPTADGYRLNSHYHFLGRPIRHCGYHECWNLRLFKHQYGRYERLETPLGTAAGDNEVHEHVILNGSVGNLTNALEHHAYPTLSVWLEKHDRYAAWEAALHDHFRTAPVPAGLDLSKIWKRRLKRLYLHLPARPVLRFIYAYFLRRGFLDGRPGLIFCGLLAFYDFLCWAKRQERELELTPLDGESAR
jgi:glycosyltransferase involved in cell wall biosynthesis